MKKFMAVALLAGLAACKKGGEVAAPAPSSAGATKSYHFAFVTNNSSDFWNIAEAGCRKAEAEASVEVVFRRPSSGDPAQQKEVIDVLVQRALKEEPFNGAFLDSLGWIYYKQNRLEEAEATLHKALERDSHDPTIHSHLGDVYAKLGRTTLAATEWEKSLSEWRRAAPADVETDKIAELEKKLGQVKHRVAQKSSAQDAKPQPQ